MTNTISLVCVSKAAFVQQEQLRNYITGQKHQLQLLVLQKGAGSSSPPPDNLGTCKQWILLTLPWIHSTKAASTARMTSNMSA